jgi:peptide/nickel transport system substrate-binding protein
MLELRGLRRSVQNAIPAYAVKFIRKDPQIRRRGPGINFLPRFNLATRSSPAGGVAAIAHAIDRQAIIRHILEGLATPATGIRSPTGPTGDVETMTTIPRSPAAPSAAGSGSRPRPAAPIFALSYKTSTNRERIAIAESIAQSLRELGIDARLRSLEFGTFFSDVRQGNFQLYSLIWTGVTDPDILYTAFHSASAPPEGANRGRYRNPRLDALLDRARTITGEADRRKLYAEAQRIRRTISLCAPLVRHRRGRP